MADSVRPTVLQINGYTMRPLQNSDLDTLAWIWADTEVTRFLPSRGLPIPRASVKKSLTFFIHHWKTQEFNILEYFETNLSAVY